MNMRSHLKKKHSATFQQNYIARHRKSSHTKKGNLLLQEIVTQRKQHPNN